MTGILNNKFVAFLKLVRIENLIMIALTQYFLRYFVIQKIWMDHQFAVGLNDGLFAVLVLSTVLIAAGGYIINDYFDVKTDMINHPDTVVLDKVIKRRHAIIYHIIFSSIGLLLGVFCALKSGYLRLAGFHIIAITLLWFYSTHFKKQLLVGNIVVSLLTASVAFIPFVFEMGLMQYIHPGFATEHTIIVFKCLKIICIFSLFSFITSLAREIIKDIEDFKGDKETGGYTMPIYWGIQASKLTAFFLIVISIILLMFVIYNNAKSLRTLNSYNIIYMIVALVLPMVVLLIQILKAKNPKHYKYASLHLKLIMLMGLGFSIMFYYG